MEQFSLNRHPADIKAAVIKRGTSLSQIARDAGLHQTTVSKALYHPCFSGEQAIAAALGVAPNEIWPARYDREGKPLHPQSQPQFNVLGKTSSSQKTVSA